MSGLCVSTSIDLMRTKFRPFALKWSRNVELRYKHRELAGKVLDLSYTKEGEVKIECEATHSLARRSPSFSVCATIKKWELIDGNTKNFYALISEAVIDEVSCTSSPGNPNCKVLSRSPVVPNSYDLALAKIANLAKLIGEKHGTATHTA